MTLPFKASRIWSPQNDNIAIIAACSGIILLCYIAMDMCVIMMLHLCKPQFLMDKNKPVTE